MLYVDDEMRSRAGFAMPDEVMVALSDASAAVFHHLQTHAAVPIPLSPSLALSIALPLSPSLALSIALPLSPSLALSLASH